MPNASTPDVCSEEVVWTQSGIDHLKAQGRFAEYGLPAVGTRMSERLQKATCESPFKKSRFSTENPQTDKNTFVIFCDVEPFL